MNKNVELFVPSEGISNKEQYFRLRDGRNLIVATDMDEVLTDICPTWVEFMISNQKAFSKHFDLERFEGKSKEEIREMVMNREVPYIDKWLKTSTEVPKVIEDLFYAMYTRNDFYSYCKPTKFAFYLKDMLNRGLIKELYVISHTMEGNKASKDKWLNDFFGSKNVKFICVPFGPGVPYISKADVINQEKIEYDVFIDDGVKNIIDVMKNTFSVGKEFLMPKLNYNNFTDEQQSEIKELLNKTKATLSKYSI